MKKILALVLVIAMILSLTACGSKRKTTNAEGNWVSATVVGYNIIDKYSAECKVFITLENDTNKYAFFSTGAPEIGASVEVYLTSTGEILDVR